MNLIFLFNLTRFDLLDEIFPVIASCLGNFLMWVLLFICSFSLVKKSWFGSLASSVSVERNDVQIIPAHGKTVNAIKAELIRAFLTVSATKLEKKFFQSQSLVFNF